MDTEEKGLESKSTGMADVFIALINGFFNLFKIEKVICMGLLYLFARDAIILKKIGAGVDLQGYLIDTEIINKFIESDNTILTVSICINCILLVTLFIMWFLVVPIYKREIDRISEIRSELMHKEDDKGRRLLKRHHSSKVQL